MTKAGLRNYYKSVRRQIDIAAKRKYDQRIIDNCRALDWSKLGRVSLFLPIEQQNEVDTRPLLAWIWQTYPHVQIYIPRLRNNQLEQVAVTPATKFTDSKFGIPEPADGPILQDELDVIFAPLLAFDNHGHRLGYGGGHYDRLFASQLQALKVGLGYGCLKAEDLPVEQHDIPLDLIVTEQKVYKFKR